MELLKLSVSNVPGALEFDGVMVYITVKKIKHSYIRVKDDGSVHMTVNQNLTQTQIREIVKTHLPKLKSQINRLQSTVMQSLPPQVYFLGEKKSLSMNEKQILLWYRKEAQQIFSERFLHGLSKVQHWHISSPNLCIRAMKSRWGSYSRLTHSVCLSLWLIKFPLELID